MILIWGIPSEPPVHLAVEAARRLDVEHVIVNQRNAANDDINFDVASGEGILNVAGDQISLSGIDGVYVRIMEPSRIPELRNGKTDQRERGEAFHEMLLAWVDSATCRVANPTRPMASNGSKPYQSQIIAECGFEVPETLVTNDPATVLEFEAAHGPLVFKSTSSIRSIVTRLDPAAKGRLDHIRRLPVQFQAQEHGPDVRVHVVGETVLAAEASTDAVDYRYASRGGEEVTLRPVDIPEEVARRCVRLSAELALPFCGVDLMRRPDDSWVCFEVNPSPGYSWYEQEAGLPIAETLVAWLAGMQD